MISIDLYNRKLDYSFVAKSEIEFLKKRYGNNFFPNSTNDSTILEFELDGIEVKQFFHKEIPKPNKDRILVFYFSDGNLTIVEELLKLYSNKTDTKIVVVTVSFAEAHLFSQNKEKEEQIKNDFLKSKNFYLIHFQPYFEQERCFFLRKIDVQNLIKFVPSVGVYHHMFPYFNTIKKNHRIGYHVNRFNSFDRIFWLDALIRCGYEKINKTLFLTINKNQFDLNSNLEIRKQLKQSYPAEIFNEIENKNNFGVHTFAPFYLEDWYLPNLFDFSLKSDIEIVYETNAFEWDFKKHLTEKTFKHLMLGKPFLCIEPTTYNLIEKYGFKNYDTLYTDDLLNLYKNTITIKNENYWPAKLSDWQPIIDSNIKWLLNMTDDEWSDKMDSCKEIAEYNHNLMDEILFEETIRDVLKKISYE